MMKTKNKNDKKFLYYPRFLLCTVKTIDSHFVPIPTLRRDDSGIEPCQVGIPTSPDKVRIPTLSKTILELSQFLHCAEHIYSRMRDGTNCRSFCTQVTTPMQTRTTRP